MRLDRCQGKEYSNDFDISLGNLHLSGLWQSKSTRHNIEVNEPTMNKEYFYLSGKEQKGPLSSEDLKNLNLSSSTLIWTEGLENWKPLSEIEELTSKSTPPPPPPSIESLQQSDKQSITSFKPTKREQIFLISWISFHLLALILSYTGIDFFNKYKELRSETFWPFTEFRGEFGGASRFLGIFADYDFTEFMVYVFCTIVLFFVYRIINPEADFRINGIAKRLVPSIVIFNFLCLLFSLKISLNGAWFSSKEFWPFAFMSEGVHFNLTNNYWSHDSGILYAYDFSEFFTYTLITVLVFCIFRTFQKRESTN
jgi:hypothetical protein